MNQVAAQEILDLIMLDDYVARKQALDAWSRKWIATLYVDAPHHGMLAQAKIEIMTKIFTALMANELDSINFGMPVGEDGNLDRTRLACEMHVILQKPRDINAGADATKRLLGMAKGGSK